VEIAGETGTSYTPLTNVVGTTYYYCVISLSGGGCSGITSAVATVVVNPIPTITEEPLATQRICVGGTIEPLTVKYTGGSGVTSYQWYNNTTNSSSGGIPIVGATSSSYTPATFNQTGTYYYYVVVSLNGSGCGSAISKTAEIQVVADPVESTKPLADQTICQSTAPIDLTLTVNGGEGVFSYQWFSNTLNSTSGGTLISGASHPVFTPPTDVVGTKYYYCVVSQSGLGCGLTSSVSKVTVAPAPTITTFCLLICFFPFYLNTNMYSLNIIAQALSFCQVFSRSCSHILTHKNTPDKQGYFIGL
jgi:hypothetical protein